MSSRGVRGLAILIAPAFAAALQSQPDFSGRWVLDGLPPSPDAARVLVVKQPITRTNVRREPIPPGFAELVIHQESATGATDERRPLGVVGGTVGGLAAAPGAAPAASTRYENVWRGNALMFLTSRSATAVPYTGNWDERRETWSLDQDGRLRVEIVTESRDEPKQTSVLLYRREP